MNSLILPDWPLPSGVKACSTTRGGGVSLLPYDSLNLGTHVGDEEQAVKRNRERLVTAAGLPQMPVWLEQVHGTRVVTLTGASARRSAGGCGVQQRAGAGVCRDDGGLSAGAVLLAERR